MDGDKWDAAARWDDRDRWIWINGMQLLGGTFRQGINVMPGCWIYRPAGVSHLCYLKVRLNVSPL